MYDICLEIVAQQVLCQFAALCLATMFFQACLEFLLMVVRPFAKLGAPSLLEYLIFGGAVSFVLLMAPVKKQKQREKQKCRNLKNEGVKKRRK